MCADVKFTTTDNVGSDDDDDDDDDGSDRSWIGNWLAFSAALLVEHHQDLDVYIHSGWVIPYKNENGINLLMGTIRVSINLNLMVANQPNISKYTTVTRTGRVSFTLSHFLNLFFYDILINKLFIYHKKSLLAIMEIMVNENNNHGVEGRGMRHMASLCWRIGRSRGSY